MASIEEINGKIAEAIVAVEEIDYNEGPEKAQKALKNLALLEKELAGKAPPGSSLGDIARRGAVGAAMRAAEFQLAKELAQQYLTEKDASRRVKSSMTALLVHIEKHLDVS